MLIFIFFFKFCLSIAGHCGIVELLIQLKANINARDDDGNTAVHLVLIKRANLNAILQHNESPQILAIYESLTNICENRAAIAIACFLFQMGIDVNVTNTKGQSALSLMEELALQDLLKTYESNQRSQESIENGPLDTQNVAGLPNVISAGGDSNENSTHQSPLRNMNCSEKKTICKMRNELHHQQMDINSTSQENSPHRKINAYQNENVSSKPVECLVCSDLSEENVELEPCGHKPACEDCSSRMKKCLECGVIVHKRMTKDGRIISAKSRQPSAERLRYLECKIAEIEESHACSICMERKKNVVFLCGHGACAKCADTLKTCHMCRKAIAKKIPVF